MGKSGKPSKLGCNKKLMKLNNLVYAEVAQFCFARFAKRNFGLHQFVAQN